jgi:hypothetical protein
VHTNFGEDRAKVSADGVHRVAQMSGGGSVGSALDDEYGYRALGLSGRSLTRSRSIQRYPFKNKSIVRRSAQSTVADCHSPGS